MSGADRRLAALCDVRAHLAAAVEAARAARDTNVEQQRDTERHAILLAHLWTVQEDLARAVREVVA